MTTAENEALARECEVFSRYLLGAAPNDYVRGKYLDAHERDPNYSAHSRFGRVLLGFAARGPGCARLADSYACLLARKSTLRKKLILLAAIFETCAPFQEVFDSTDAGGQGILIARLAGRGVLFALYLLVALALFAPVHVLQGLRPSGGKERR
jgi:hypothetical protein